MPQATPQAPQPLDPVTAMGMCIGPVHRMVWGHGEPTEGQTHARALLEQQLPQAWELGGDDRRLAGLVNLWLTLTTGDDPLRSSWSIQDEWPGPLGRALRSLLDVQAKEPVLMALRRPWRFARARAALTALTRSHPHFRSNPAPTIFHEAREDALSLLRAARSPQTPPPAHLDLLHKDPEDWASEARGEQQLLPGVKVWKTLVEWLRKLQAAARDVVSTWTDRSSPRTVLPPGHKEALTSMSPGHRHLAEAVLADLDLQQAPDQATPALLRPATALAMMSKALKDASWPARVSWLPIAEEAVEGATEGITPLWAQQAQAQRHHLLEEIDVLRQRARRKATGLPEDDARPLWEAVDLLDEAKVQLHHYQADDAQEWVQLAQQAMATAMRSEKLAREEQRILTLWARLRDAGLLTKDLSSQPEAGNDDWPSTARAVEAQWRTVQDRFQKRLEGLSHKAHWLHDIPRRQVVGRVLELASTALQDGALTRASSAMDRAQEQLTAARRDLERDMEPSLRALWLRAKACAPSDDALFTLEAQLLRTSRRTQVGLPHAIRRQALSDWVVAAENGTLGDLPLLARVASGVATPVMWWDTLIPCDGLALDPLDAGTRKDGFALLRHGELTPLPPERYHFAPVGTGDASYRFDDDRVEGPYGDDGRPSHPQGLVARLPVDAFQDWFGLIDLDHTPWIIERPTLAQLLDRGAELVDRLREDEQSTWLDGLLTDLSPIDPTVVARAIDRLRAMELPPHIVEERLDRLSALHGASRHLAQARGAAVRAWLHSDDGAVALRTAARAHVDEHPELWDAPLKARHEQMEEELARMQALHEKLQQRATQARNAAEAAEQVIDDARFQLVGRWWSEQGGTGGTPAPQMATHERIPPAVWPEPSLHAPSTLEEVAEDLWRSTHLSELEAANLLACLLVGRATLVVGPPGSGKTTFLAHPLERLGLGAHRAETLQVPGGSHTRSDLLGNLDASQGLYQPGRLGLTEHLGLGAQHHGATWLPLWFEDLHLGVHGPTWRQLVNGTDVSLYAPELRPSNRGTIPPSLAVPSQLCLVGTASLLPERPLPDLLLADAWCIERRPDLADLLRPFQAPTPEPRPLDLRWLRQLAEQAPAASTRPLNAPLRLLFGAGLQGLPGHRTMSEVRAFLAIAQTLMPSAQAFDLALVQRILPSVQGVGPAAREGLLQVREACLAEGWTLSAARLERIVKQGIDMGDAFVGLPA